MTSSKNIIQTLIYEWQAQSAEQGAHLWRVIVGVAVLLIMVVTL